MILNRRYKMKNTLIFNFLFIVVSCNHDPKIINYGNENCDFCKMTIMDDKFSAQCISKKGKSFKFDDIHCLVSFLQNGGIWSNEVDRIYFSDFMNKGMWLEPNKAFFIKSELLRSPMGGNIAVFSTEEQRNEANKQYNGEKLLWDNIKLSK